MSAEPTALHDRNAVAAFLTQNIGVEKATHIVSVACELLGFSGGMTRPQCLQVLEKIAEQDGIIGVTARFAKSRAILRLV